MNKGVTVSARINMEIVHFVIREKCSFRILRLDSFPLVQERKRDGRMNGLKFSILKMLLMLQSN